ncbi:MAG: acyltransferase [Sphingomonadales bacterium]|nr:acyltransferase [Sphingomonadales bacterium]
MPVAGPGPAAPRPGEAQIVSVQALRLVAATLVLLSHAEIFGHYLAGVLAAPPPGPLRLLHGGFGVDLFFAISGFVMIVSAGRPGPGLDRTSFLRRRIVRVAPLYWLATLFVTGWYHLLDKPPRAGAVLRSLLFVPHAGPTGRVAPVLDVGWTLNYEIAFYALFALALGRRVAGTALRVLALLAALVAAGAAWELPLPLWAWARPILLEFGAGIGVALLWRRGVRLPVTARVLLALAAVAAAALWDPSGPATGPQRVLTVGLGGALALAAAVLGPLPLPGPPLWRIGGDISYALYLCHIPVMLVTQYAWQALAWTRGPWLLPLFGAVTVLASFALAALVHRRVERPVTAWLNRQLARRVELRTAPA